MKFKLILVKLVERIYALKYSYFITKKKIYYQKEFNKIALILTKPLGIGDLIMMTPLIKTFKENFPNSKIHLITDKDIFDEKFILEIDKIHIVKGSIFKLNKEFKLLSNKKFDLGVIMCRGINQVLYLERLNCKYKLGYLGGYKILSNFKLKNEDLKFEKEEHFSNMGLKIADSLGLKINNFLINPKFSKKIKHSIQNKLNKLNLDYSKPIIGLNTNVMWESRRWDENNYIELIKKLNKNYNFILLGGSGKDVDLNNYIENQLKKENIEIQNLTGKLNLKESIFFMSKLNLLLTADSGPMHFAFMMKTPTLALFGPINPKFRLPLNKSYKNIFSSLWYCNYKKCNLYNYESEHIDKEMNGLKAIPVSDVEKKILKFFKNKSFN